MERIRKEKKQVEKIEIIHNQVNEAVFVMKEVAQWGREQGFRVWPEEWH